MACWRGADAEHRRAGAASRFRMPMTGRPLLPAWTFTDGRERLSSVAPVSRETMPGSRRRIPLRRVKKFRWGCALGVVCCGANVEGIALGSPVAEVTVPGEMRPRTARAISRPLTGTAQGTEREGHSRTTPTPAISAALGWWSRLLGSGSSHPSQSACKHRTVHGARVSRETRATRAAYSSAQSNVR